MQKNYPISLFVKEIHSEQIGNVYPELGISISKNIKNKDCISNQNGLVIFRCEPGEEIYDVYPFGLIVVKGTDGYYRILKLRKTNSSPDNDVFDAVDEIIRDVSTNEKIGSIYRLTLKKQIQDSDPRIVFLDGDGNTFGKDLNIYDSEIRTSPSGRYTGIEVSCHSNGTTQNHILYIDNDNPHNCLMPVASNGEVAITSEISNDGYAIYKVRDYLSGQMVRVLYSIKDRRELTRAEDIDLHGVSENGLWENGVVHAETEYIDMGESVCSGLPISSLFELGKERAHQLIRTQKIKINADYYPYLIISKQSDEGKDKDVYCLGLVSPTASGEHRIGYFMPVPPSAEQQDNQMSGAFVERDDIPFGYSSVDIYPLAGVAVLRDNYDNSELIYHPVTNSLIKSAGEVKYYKENGHILIAREKQDGQTVFTAYLSTPQSIVNVPQATRVAGGLAVHHQEGCGRDLLVTPNGPNLLVRSRARTQEQALKEMTE